MEARAGSTEATVAPDEQDFRSELDADNERWDRTSEPEASIDSSTEADSRADVPARFRIQLPLRRPYRWLSPVKQPGFGSVDSCPNIDMERICQDPRCVLDHNFCMITLRSRVGRQYGQHARWIPKQFFEDCRKVDPTGTDCAVAEQACMPRSTRLSARGRPASG